LKKKHVPLWSSGELKKKLAPDTPPCLEHVALYRVFPPERQTDIDPYSYSTKNISKFSHLKEQNTTNCTVVRAYFHGLFHDFLFLRTKIY
jgi:hypothetical protein